MFELPLPSSKRHNQVSIRIRRKLKRPAGVERPLGRLGTDERLWGKGWKVGGRKRRKQSLYAMTLAIIVAPADGTRPIEQTVKRAKPNL